MVNVKTTSSIRILGDLPSAELNPEDYLASVSAKIEDFIATWNQTAETRLLAVEAWSRSTHFALDLNNDQYDYQTAHRHSVILPVYLLRYSSRRRTWKFLRYQRQGAPLAELSCITRTVKILFLSSKTILKLSRTAHLDPLCTTLMVRDELFDGHNWPCYSRSWSSDCDVMEVSIIQITTETTIFLSCLLLLMVCDVRALQDTWGRGAKLRRFLIDGRFPRSTGDRQDLRN